MDSPPADFHPSVDFHRQFAKISNLGSFRGFYGPPDTEAATHTDKTTTFACFGFSKNPLFGRQVPVSRIDTVEMRRLDEVKDWLTSVGVVLGGPLPKDGRGEVALVVCKSGGHPAPG